MEAAREEIRRKYEGGLDQIISRYIGLDDDGDDIVEITSRSSTIIRQSRVNESFLDADINETVNVSFLRRGACGGDFRYEALGFGGVYDRMCVPCSFDDIFHFFR